MDIAAYISELDKNTGDVLQLLKECSEEQLEQKTGSDWSILEILEHLLLTDRFVYALLVAPAGRLGDTPEIIGSERMKRMLIDMRARKAIAPEMLVPRGEIKNNSAFIEQFMKERAFLVEALENGKIVADNGVIKHPAMGDMTKSDWLHFIIIHTNRHLLHIQDRLAAQ